MSVSKDVIKQCLISKQRDVVKVDVMIKATNDDDDGSFDFNY